ncbi:hypothetical protein [Endozoicomonas sp. ALB115]|uniref:hypothetical protein n=1 Tax=Endozoicomonas sp. ALB115 TaxID=3403074 RepID=UPI003BB813E5
MKQKLISTLNWTFGVIFALAGIVTLLTSPIGGLLWLVIAGLLLPPVRNFAYGKTGKVLALKYRAAALTVLYIVSLLFIGQAEQQEEHEKALALGFKDVAEQQIALGLGFDNGADYQQYLSDLQAAKEAQVAAEKAKAEEEARLAKLEKEQEEKACRESIECWGKRNIGEASIACDGPIERFAQYDYEWTEGFFGEKFSRAIWTDRKAGHIKYVGDQIKFQNGFGAWQNYRYACYFDTISREVLNVEVFSGRL